MIDLIFRNFQPSRSSTIFYCKDSHFYFSKSDLLPKIPIYISRSNIYISKSVFSLRKIPRSKQKALTQNIIIIHTLLFFTTLYLFQIMTHKHILSKLFWGFLFLIGIGTFVFFSQELIRSFVSFETTTDIEVRCSR